MLKAVIVEDETRSRETLGGLLKLYCKNVDVVAEADGVQTGINAISEHQPDVVFLDIQMPDGSGFKLLESLTDINFDIIFTTAYDQFAIKAIKFSAIDYLLKPIFPDDLVAAVKKAEERQLARDLLARARAAMDEVRDYDQDQVDRLCRAVGWATFNEKTFTRLAQMGVDESGLGDREGRPGVSAQYRYSPEL